MYHFVPLSSITTVCLELEVKQEYLQSRASRCLSLSSSSSGDVSSTLESIEILVLTSWILHPGICVKKPNEGSSDLANKVELEPFRV